ncbi:hypothetical protein D3C87_1576180 [compost metagenome]
METGHGNRPRLDLKSAERRAASGVARSTSESDLRAVDLDDSLSSTLVSFFLALLAAAASAALRAASCLLRSASISLLMIA